MENNEFFASVFGEPTAEPTSTEQHDLPSHTANEDSPAEVAANTSKETTETANEPAAEVQESAGEHDEKGKPGPVPIATFLDMRDNWKEQRDLAARLQRELDEAKAAQKPVVSPDPATDPRGFANHLQAQIDQQMLDYRLQMSADAAFRTHGADKVREAASWGEARAANDPTFHTAFVSAVNPAEWLVQQHQSAVRLDEMQRDPVAYARRIAEEQGWIAGATQAATQVAPAPTQTSTQKNRPMSLTDAPTATGKATPANSANNFFKSVFGQ